VAEQQEQLVREREQLELGLVQLGLVQLGLVQLGLGLVQPELVQ